MIPKLFLVVDLRLFQATQVFLLTSILVIQFLHLTLLGWSMQVLGGWRGDVWRTGIGIAAFCLFCPSQWFNFVLGLQVNFVLLGLFCHRVVYRSAPALDSLTRTTRQPAYDRLPSAFDPRSAGRHLYVGKRKSSLAIVGDRGVVASIASLSPHESGTNRRDQHCALFLSDGYPLDSNDHNIWGFLDHKGPNQLGQVSEADTHLLSLCQRNGPSQRNVIASSTGQVVQVCSRISREPLGTRKSPFGGNL